MMCAETKVFERQAHQSGTGAMYWDHAPAHTANIASSYPMPSLQHQNSNAHASPSLPHVHGMAQDFEQFGVVGHGHGGGGVSLPPHIDHSSDFGAKPRGLWCFGLQSDLVRECSFLLNKNGLLGWGSKPAAETSVEGGVLVVRSQLCPWASSNVEMTDRIATTDPTRYQRLLEDALSSDVRRSSRMGIFCKYCATLEKDLTASLEVKVEVKEKWTDENWGDMNFKQVDQFFEKTVSPVVELETNCRKRKYGPEDWENDRALVLLKMNELNMRAARAEQRVLELEQLLREHALVGAPDDTCDDSEILTPLPQHVCLEEHAEVLVCKLPGCNKSFKSSKTLRRHLIQKHSDNARFLVCNQPTVNGVMCRFETIHSGVLSYHRKHSLAHQRREDWHISCPFCQSRFARQHEMDRHQRICKSRPVASVSESGSLQKSMGSMSEGFTLPQQLSGFVIPDRGHNHQHFSMAESNIESSITY